MRANQAAVLLEKNRLALIKMLETVGVPDAYSAASDIVFFLKCVSCDVDTPKMRAIEELKLEKFAEAVVAEKQKLQEKQRGFLHKLKTHRPVISWQPKGGPIHGQRTDTAQRHTDTQKGG